MAEPLRIPAIVMAGDRRAARAIRGESKVYLPIAGRPLVAHTVAVLQRVPELSEVWVVGNAPRLEAVLGSPEFRAVLRKPLYIVPQFRNLYENAWQTWRRTLPGAGPAGRDPGPEDAGHAALFLSADLPFATAQEISAFVRRGQALGCDYALGLTGESGMVDFYPEAPGAPGIRMPYFNLREGRFRQNNLHLVKPARLGNRHYVEEMYEHRYQREFGNAIGLAWRLLRSEGGGMAVLLYYLLIQLAGFADRRGWRWLADRLRQAISLVRVEQAVGKLLRTHFQTVVTEAGGCAVDIDNEHDYEVACQRFESWRRGQEERVEKLYGPLALPAEASAPGSASVRVLASGAP